MRAFATPAPNCKPTHAPTKISSGAQSLGEVTSAVDVVSYTILLLPGGELLTVQMSRPLVLCTI